jgi:ubiquinone/menaquinone biosynthesis C-methylase UbiE
VCKGDCDDPRRSGFFAVSRITPGVVIMSKSERIVEEGYDKIAQEYHDQRDQLDRRKDLERFAGLMPKDAKVLDAGCGSGVPVARFLAERGFWVVGVDLSRTMIKLAKENVPQAEFLQKDMTKLDFEEDSFDGLTAFYSIIHVPREKHSGLFETFRKILKPNGVMLVSLGHDEWEGIEEYHGAEMFWSHYGPERSLQVIKKANFEILFDKFAESGEEKHYWILAKSKSS